VSNGCVSEEPDNTSVEGRTALRTDAAEDTKPVPEDKATVPVGPNPTRLSELGGAGEPAFFPSGGKIAFHNFQGGLEVREQFGNAEEYPQGLADVYVMNSDGTGVINLTNSPEANDLAPAPSPSGEKLAFASYRASLEEHNGATDTAVQGASRIWLADADGPDPTSGPELIYLYVAWAPDGNKIAFGCDRGGSQEICAMESDGTDVIRLTNTAGIAANLNPSFSPDGKKIAYQRCQFSDGECQIYLMSSDATNPKSLTAGTPQVVHDEGPVFSPDGTKVAFMRIGARTDIYVVNTDGTDLTKLTGGLANGVDPAFSPDGEKIAFTGNSGAPDEIYTVGVDGTDLTNITKNDSASDSQPVFSPDGDWIAYRSARYDGSGNYISGIYLMDLEKRLRRE